MTTTTDTDRLAAVLEAARDLSLGVRANNADAIDSDSRTGVFVQLGWIRKLERALADFYKQEL